MKTSQKRKQLTSGCRPLAPCVLGDYGVTGVTKAGLSLIASPVARPAIPSRGDPVVPLPCSLGTDTVT